MFTFGIVINPKHDKINIDHDFPYCVPVMFPD